MQRAQLLRDAALAVRDSGVPVWTTAIPEAAGVLGLFAENVEVLSADGFRSDATETVLDVLPGMLGGLTAGGACSVRTDGVGGVTVARFRVGRGPTPRPPDGILSRYTLTPVQTVSVP